MRTQTQRLEDRRDLGHDIDEVALELCRTIDDAAERIAASVNQLAELADAMYALNETLRRVRA
jgi:hypothetical protein